MAILGKGPGPKKKVTSKIGTNKEGQTVAAPGYKMGLMRNQKAIKEPTKTYTTGSGPAAVTRTQQQGIIGPKPTGGGVKAAPAPAKKGPTAVGKAIAKTKSSIEIAARRRKATSAYRGGGGRGRRGGGKTCAAYR